MTNEKLHEEIDKSLKGLEEGNEWYIAGNASTSMLSHFTFQQRPIPIQKVIDLVGILEKGILDVELCNDKDFYFPKIHSSAIVAPSKHAWVIKNTGRYGYSGGVKKYCRVRKGFVFKHKGEGSIRVVGIRLKHITNTLEGNTWTQLIEVVGEEEGYIYDWEK